MKPMYEHDCEACRHLGTVNGADGVVDLYMCPRDGGLGPSLVARFGDDGPDYTSVPAQYAESLTGRPELKAAAALAKNIKF